MVFNEVYGSYYNVVAEVITEAISGTLDRKKIMEIVERKAFGESVVAIPDNLQNNKWPLIDSNFRTPIKHVPTMPLTDIQRMWLKAILLDPRVQLFDPVMTGLEDVEPLFDQDTFVFFDRYSDGDPFTNVKYRENFRHALIGIREHHKVIVTFDGRKGRRRQLLLPERIEYSSKDDKFRLIGSSVHGRSHIFNMARIESCELVEKYSPEEFIRPKFAKDTVILELTDERNALERVMLAFSDLEKETEKLDDIHYRIRLSYRRDDVTEILIRIMAFGPMLKVLEPTEFRNLITERLFRQKSCGL